MLEFDGFGVLLVKKLIQEVNKEDALKMVEFWTMQGMINRKQADSLIREIEKKYKDD